MAANQAVVTMDQVKYLIAKAVEKETAEMKKDIMTLKSKNKQPNDKVTKLEWALDEAERYYITPHGAGDFIIWLFIFRF